MKVDINAYLKSNSKMVEDWLDKNLIGYSEFSNGLTDSMRYSIFAGGKRLRPSLMIAAYSVFKDNIDDIIPFAAAIEVIHTYSLIHDDLPAMDNDDLRRGNPTNHKVYGEATAILAGDALLTKAFFLMSNKYSDNIDDNKRLKAIEMLAKLSGDEGMVAGQYVDIISEGKVIDIKTVEFIHLNKTAALIKYCTSVGALLGGANDEEVEKFQNFGNNIGLAFQIVDDILDLTSTSEELGKNVNSDIENNKSTYPKLIGLESSKKMADDLVSLAESDMSNYGDRAKYLLCIAEFITARRY